MLVESEYLLRGSVVEDAVGGDLGGQAWSLLPVPGFSSLALRRSRKEFRIASVIDSPVVSASSLARRSASSFLMLSAIWC